MTPDRDATCAWDCQREFPHEGPCNRESVAERTRGKLARLARSVEEYVAARDAWIDSGRQISSDESGRFAAATHENQQARDDVFNLTVVQGLVDALTSASPASTHRCSGCGHRWDGPLTGAELCGDCWRKGQAVIFASHRTTP